MKSSVFTLLLATGLPAAAQSVYQGPGGEAWLAAREVQWRQSALPGIESQDAVISVDSEARRYVEALGNRLANGAPGPARFECRFILYDDSVGLQVPWFGRLQNTRQANALPGGIVLVPASLFAVSADEAEFAAAVARSVAHVALRHFARTAQLRSRLAMPFPKTLLFTRSFEREADYAAAAILSRAGIDPAGLKRCVTNGRASFDTSEQRVQAVDQALSQLPPRAYGPSDSPRFDALKTRMAERAVV